MKKALTLIAALAAFTLTATADIESIPKRISLELDDAGSIVHVRVQYESVRKVDGKVVERFPGIEKSADKAGIDLTPYIDNALTKALAERDAAKSELTQVKAEHEAVVDAIKSGDVATAEAKVDEVKRSENAKARAEIERQIAELAARLAQIPVSEVSEATKVAK